MTKSANSAKRILMINSHCGWFGGVESLLADMVRSLNEHGWQVYGLFEKGDKDDASFSSLFCGVIIHEEQDFNSLLDYYLELGISAVMIHKTTRTEWIRPLSKHLPTFLIVHDHDYYCLRRHKYFPYKRKNCYLPFCIPSCSVCSMLIQKKDNRINRINPFKHKELLTLMRNSTCSFVLSEAMRENLLKNGWEKERIRKLIPYKVPREAEYKPVAEKPLILYVGQLIRGKGIELLLKAAALLDMEYQLLIYGKGNDDAYLKELAKNLEIADKVIFKGFSLDLEEAYKEASLLVVPSRWQEPFALVGLEAFAHKVPVVGFDVGGISEWLKHKINGLLVKEGDTQKLAKAISTLLQNPLLAQEYGENGYQMLKDKYNKAAFEASFLKPLESLIKEKDKESQISYTLVQKTLLKCIQIFLGITVSLPVAITQILSAGTAFDIELKSYRDLAGKTQSLPLIKSKNWLLRNALLFPLSLLGKLELVGTSLPESAEDRIHSPGIFSLHFICNSSKMANSSRGQSDREYLANRSFLYDLGIILKSFIAGFYHQSEPDNQDVIELFKLNITNSSMQEALADLGKRLEAKEKTEVFFINADCINKIFIDKDYYQILLGTALLYPDGSGMNLAARILGKSLKENLNGTDLLPQLCELAVAGGYKIYLLGAAEGVADAAREKLIKRFAGLQIVGAAHGYFDWESEADSVIERINASGADILLVAFGAPLQEKFIRRYGNRINASLLMGVGGLFDFYSGQIPRAPLWLREIGMEWTYRLYQEPRRMWKRYILGNPLFLYRVFRWRKKTPKLLEIDENLSGTQ
ncbi:MAG: WecB/TagA/CpsF family glycosyltransferase [Candidatus Cloacimonetes bacterium]|nr:WecB/TagA/CpsF family glycosyltransferase [Candidatus Cloacimonadota bacterium]